MYKKTNFYIMYNYDYKEELENFKNEFLYYLPFYILNDDHLITINESNGIDNELKIRSLAIKKKNPITPKRLVENDGIYGELFLDFYLRIVRTRYCIILFL